jgi:nitroimidazol reductase NimA-like FMN-containing flavoprotein (pyridoxamine 5'-phosphate oxidase superfamily)
MTPEHIHPRRKDRSKSEDWIRDFLHSAGSTVISTVLEGRPRPIPILFAYDEDREAIYVHTGQSSQTKADLEGEGGAGAPVALTCFEMGRLLPAKEALEFSVEYASVVVFGRGTVVEDPTESHHGLQLIMDKYAPHLRPERDYRPIAPEEVQRTAVLRIDIDAWSGKEKTAEKDFPGAYRFEDVRGGTPG